ncbi:hypothetical protein AA974_03460 [Helicobacter pylori]|nr:hypothetical protein AA974_03460 [Helicobacter pylori]
MLLLGFISIFSSSLFCFCLAIFVAKTFQGTDVMLVLLIPTFFIVASVILFLLSANRMLFIPKERMR